jgi:homoserine O-acetyltransferase
MRTTHFLAAWLLTSMWTVQSTEAAESLQTASLGDFQLVNGEVIRDLKIGYRTLGELNRSKSNAILFPTWFTGTTADLVERVIGEGLLDPSKFFVILVDALGDGVSSSPSNSVAQPHMQFPRFTIRDMVHSQHKLVTEVLGIPHLKAVMGISMGGMQTFEWIVSYPNFMDKAVPIHGSPRLSSYDLLLWTAEVRAIQNDPAWAEGEYSSPPLNGMKTVAAINSLAVTTPEYVIDENDPADFDEFLGKTEQSIIQGFDANNWIRQAQAMMDHDVFARFEGSMEKAAAAVRAEVLVVVGTQDHMVTPQPALEFAQHLFAPVVEIPSSCGHLSLWCEMESTTRTISQFLEK